MTRALLLALVLSGCTGRGPVRLPDSGPGRPVDAAWVGVDATTTPLVDGGAPMDDDAGSAPCLDPEIERVAAVAELNDRTPGACVLEAQRARGCCCSTAELSRCAEERCYDRPSTEGCPL